MIRNTHDIPIHTQINLLNINQPTGFQLLRLLQAQHQRQEFRTTRWNLLLPTQSPSTTSTVLISPNCVSPTSSRHLTACSPITHPLSVD